MRRNRHPLLESYQSFLQDLYEWEKSLFEKRFHRLVKFNELDHFEFSKFYNKCVLDDQPGYD